MLGLNNVKMAHADNLKDNTMLNDHASFNKEIFYEQKPDLFLLYAVFIPASQMDTMGWISLDHVYFKEIEKDAKFRLAYSACSIVRKGRLECFQTYASRVFLNRLDTNFFKVTRYN